MPQIGIHESTVESEAAEQGQHTAGANGLASDSRESISAHYRDERVTVYGGDCLEVMPALEADSFHAIVTDPPYHLVETTKRFANESAERVLTGQPGVYQRHSRGFMGQTWDGGDVAFRAETWAAAYRVLKPGGHLVAFGSTRTYHRLVCAIEDAGFEIRDTISWLFGSGFPKSHSISKALSETLSPDVRCACAHRSTQRVEGSLGGYQENRGSGDAPLHPEGDSALGAAPPRGGAPERSRADQRRGVQASSRASTSPGAGSDHPSSDCSPALSDHLSGVSPVAGSTLSDKQTSTSRGGVTSARKTAFRISGTQYSDAGSEASSRGGVYPNLAHCDQCGGVVIPAGLGTALKPAMELICLARKPLAVKNVAGNVAAHGVGAINVDGCRIGPSAEYANKTAGNGRGDGYRLHKRKSEWAPSSGRWPANVCLDEEAAEVLDEQSGTLVSGANPTRRGSDKFRGVYSAFAGQRECEPARGVDVGGASRFFYTAKASASERQGTTHPTVKPVALMRWLCRLVTPPKGRILDPFAGSGTTRLAALAEGFRVTLIEKNPDYLEQLCGRVAHLSLPLEVTA